MAFLTLHSFIHFFSIVWSCSDVQIDETLIWLVHIVLHVQQCELTDVSLYSYLAKQLHAYSHLCTVVKLVLC